MPHIETSNGLIGQIWRPFQQDNKLWNICFKPSSCCFGLMTWRRLLLGHPALFSDINVGPWLHTTIWDRILIDFCNNFDSSGYKNQWWSTSFTYCSPDHRLTLSLLSDSSKIIRIDSTFFRGPDMVVLFVENILYCKEFFLRKDNVLWFSIFKPLNEVIGFLTSSLFFVYLWDPECALAFGFWQALL